MLCYCIVYETYLFLTWWIEIGCRPQSKLFMFMHLLFTLSSNDALLLFFIAFYYSYYLHYYYYYYLYHFLTNHLLLRFKGFGSYDSYSGYLSPNSQCGAFSHSQPHPKDKHSIRRPHFLPFQISPLQVSHTNTSQNEYFLQGVVLIVLAL